MTSKHRFRVGASTIQTPENVHPPLRSPTVAASHRLLAIKAGKCARHWLLSVMLLTGCVGPGIKSDIASLEERLETSSRGSTNLPWLPASPVTPDLQSVPPLLVSSVEIQRLPLNTLLQALSQQENLSTDADECGAVAVSIGQQHIELTDLLDRLADLARIRWRLDGSRLSIRCDQPLLRTYRIDYPAVERSGAMTGTAGLPGQGGSGMASQPGLTPSVTGGGQQQTASRNQNRFWDNLVQTVEQWLAAGEELSEPTRITETELSRTDQGETQPTSEPRHRNARENPQSKSFSGTLESNLSRTVTTRVDQRRNQVMAHPESGLLHVRASARQHRQLARLLAQTRIRSRQQVEIQALLLEVRLSGEYERGIQWFNPSARLSSALPISQANPGLIFSRQRSGEDGTGLAIRFLEQFGAVQVLSSPRIVALHQQSALLRMVENRVYFTVSAQTVPAGPNSAAFSTFNTQAHSIPVGFTMTVLPSVDESQTVTLTLRPSLSRIIGFVSDPNPGLVTANINSRIPEVQIREVESVIRLQDGQVALMGGFTQAERRGAIGGVPGFSQHPMTRWLGTSESTEDAHSELVVLIRTRVTPVGDVL